jgi:hypothetical protein
MSLTLEMSIIETSNRTLLSSNARKRLRKRSFDNQERDTLFINDIDYAEDIHSCYVCGAYCYCYTSGYRGHVYKYLKDQIAKYSRSEAKRSTKKYIGLYIDTSMTKLTEPEFDDSFDAITMLAMNCYISKKSGLCVGRHYISYVIDPRTCKILDADKKEIFNKAYSVITKYKQDD